VDFDDPVLAGPDAPDGTLSRAMAFDSAPRNVWRLDRLDDWHRVIEGVRFSSDYNRPFTNGTLRSGAPDDPVAVLRDWGGPVLILHGVREMSFPIGVARRLHAELSASCLVEVPEAAHMAHFDNPEYWLGAIRGFLKAGTTSSPIMSPPATSPPGQHVT
jgi:pimeloyl-ACP methyl ester carboxylesterase